MEEGLERTRESWEQWLRSAKLAAGTSPRTARLVFQEVEIAKSQSDKINELRQRITAMQQARDEHLSLACKVILELSDTHQILFFTCHPETVEFLRRERPIVPLYRIGDGRVEIRRDGES